MRVVSRITIELHRVCDYGDMDLASTSLELEMARSAVARVKAAVLPGKLPPDDSGYTAVVRNIDFQIIEIDQ